MGFDDSLRRRVGCAAVLFLAAAIQPRSTAEELAVNERGSIILPMEVDDAEGAPVAVEGLSGIAWMGDDRYLGVMDNSRSLLSFRLELADDGRPVSASKFAFLTIADRGDYEDVVWLPHGTAGRVLLCEEDSPGIHAVDLESGRRLASLAVPEIFRSRRPNRGFESLAIDAGGRHVWTANEEPLAVDGPAVTADAAGAVRLTRIPITRPDAAGKPAAIQHAYPVDPPHRFVKLLDGPVFSGVTAILCLSPDRLLVLERSGGRGLPPFESRLYDVSLDGAEDVSGVRERLVEKASAMLAKRLVWKGQLGINLEGLCLGRELADGGRAIVGIGDNGGLDTPSRIVVFGLASR
jgi:hypothetical protein